MQTFRQIYLFLAVFMLTLVGVVLIFPDRSSHNVRGVSDEGEAHLVGIILPHHDVARPLLIDAYEKAASKDDFDLIVVFGPNHFFPEIKEVVVKSLPQEFAAGAAAGLFMINPEIVAADHAISVHIPYLDEVFSLGAAAAVAPARYFALLPAQYSEIHQEAMVELVQHLQKTHNKILIIASVDFSHDTNFVHAMKNNDQSIAAIKAFDYSRIRSFTNDHLDSPNSINALLRLMRFAGRERFEVWHSSHSAFLLEDLTSVGTSYVLGVFK